MKVPTERDQIPSFLIASSCDSLSGVREIEHLTAVYTGDGWDYPYDNGYIYRICWIYLSMWNEDNTRGGILYDIQLAKGWQNYQTNVEFGNSSEICFEDGETDRTIKLLVCFSRVSFKGIVYIPLTSGIVSYSMSFKLIFIRTKLWSLWTFRIGNFHSGDSSRLSFCLWPFQMIKTLMVKSHILKKRIRYNCYDIGMPGANLGRDPHLAEVCGLQGTSGKELQSRGTSTSFQNVQSSPKQKFKFFHDGLMM